MLGQGFSFACRFYVRLCQLGAVERSRRLDQREETGSFLCVSFPGQKRFVPVAAIDSSWLLFSSPRTSLIVFLQQPLTSQQGLSSRLSPSPRRFSSKFLRREPLAGPLRRGLSFASTDPSSKLLCFRNSVLFSLILQL